MWKRIEQRYCDHCMDRLWCCISIRAYRSYHYCMLCWMERYGITVSESGPYEA